VKNLQYIDLIL